MAIAFVHGPAMACRHLGIRCVAIPFDGPCHDGNSTHLPDLTKAPSKSASSRYVFVRINQNASSPQIISNRIGRRSTNEMWGM